MGSIWDGEDTAAGLLWILTSIGSINWALLEWLDTNLVVEIGAVAGGGTTELILYGLIGFAGVVTLLDHLGLYNVTDVVDQLRGVGGN